MLRKKIKKKKGEEFVATNPGTSLDVPDSGDEASPEEQEERARAQRAQRREARSVLTKT